MYLVYYLVVLLIYFFKTSILLFLATNPLQNITKSFEFSLFVASFSGVSLKLLSGYLAIGWLVGLP
jgi:hypothetical protein